MIREIDVRSALSLEDYAQHALLAPKVQALRTEAAQQSKKLSGRTIWMLNSTERGGGVAEMLPKLVHLFRHLDVDTRWCVMEPREPEFFRLTKRLHNAIHGVESGDFSAADKELYESVSREVAASLKSRLKPEDVLIVHDPQPAAVAAFLPADSVKKTIWRCHIGLSSETETTLKAWSFLKPYVSRFDHSVFSAPAYIAPYLTKCVSIIQPAIDPLSHKNRPLHPVKLVGVLANAGLLHTPHPLLTDPFPQRVARLSGAGQFQTLDGATEIGLLFRPIIAQISRWDRLKGWFPLLGGFVRMKERLDELAGTKERSRRRLQVARLVLAGPEPASVSDDPEASEVLDELKAKYRELPRKLQDDIAVLSLPMKSKKYNALIVNALQRSSSLIVQNSLREGFGLSVTEALWKQTAVLGTNAYGIRQQINHGIEGMLVDDPTDADDIATIMARFVNAPKEREATARCGHHRVANEFLLFRQLTDWLRLIGQLFPHDAAASTL